MANDIQLKRSSVAGRVPDAANVLVGEPVINLADKILYTKTGSGEVIVIGAGTTSNIAEGTNLYFTNARARTSISVSGAGSYDNSTGVITITGGVTSVGGATGAVSNAQLASGITTSGILNTSNVIEGGNLYFTNARVATAVAAQTLTNVTFSGNVVAGNLSTSGSLTASGNLTANGSIISGGLSGFYVDTVAAGTTSNVLYYNVTTKEFTYGSISSGVTSVAGATGAVSNAQLASGITSSGILTTANVSEVTNLYYTNARVWANVSPTLALKANVADLTTSNVSEGSHLYFTNARSIAAFTEGDGINIDANGLITSTVTSSSTSNSFATIQVSGQTSVTAESSTDTLTLEATGLLDITTDAPNNKVVIGSTNKAFPFYNSLGAYAAVPLRVTDTALTQTLNNVYLPFTKNDGSQVTTLKVQ